MSKNNKQRNKKDKDQKAPVKMNEPNVESNAWWADEKRARHAKRLKDQQARSDRNE